MSGMQDVMGPLQMAIGATMVATGNPQGAMMIANGAGQTFGGKGGGGASGGGSGGMDPMAMLKMAQGAGSLLQPKQTAPGLPPPPPMRPPPPGPQGAIPQPQPGPGGGTMSGQQNPLAMLMRLLQQQRMG